MTEGKNDQPTRLGVTTQRLIRAMRQDRRLMIAVGLLAMAIATLNTLVPRLLGLATDEMLAGLDADGVDFGVVGRLLTVAILASVGASLFTMTQGRIIATLVQRLTFRMRRDVETKLSMLPLSYFDTKARGELLSTATNDIDNIQQTLQGVLNRQIVSMLMVVAVPVMMFVVSPLLTVIVLLTVPITLWATRTIGRRAQPRFGEQWEATAKLHGHVEELYTGHALVSSFGRREEAAATFRRHNDALFESGTKAQFLSGLIQPVLTFVGNVNYVLVAVVGGLRVAAGALSIGDIQALIQYVLQFNQPVTGMAAMSSQIQSAVASAERVFQLLDVEEQPTDSATAAMPDAIQGVVRFDDVSFRYLPDQPIIDGLSLTVEPGQTVAIVGPTGAGKTTIVNLLMRFHEIDTGRITIDGADIAQVHRDELRSRIGMVLQDTWLFGGTIADNIAYGAPHATRDQVVAAARAVHADAFIRMLPDGYETIIDDEGGGLSAGERQLVTIARAFLIEPSMLLLDEATSSVDTRTEMLIQRAMATLRQGRTSFIVAHRLSTVRDADVILVMEHGQVVEQGTHDQLVSTDGAYARLYRAQFSAEPAFANRG
jgi:ATP-binding cassette subfamily B multidrug efflux pump